MKIIYSGGWDKTSQESIQNSFMYQYDKIINEAAASGKKIAIVTLAKPDGSYDAMIRLLFGNVVDIIDYKRRAPEWQIYDGIFILGGNAEMLKNGMVKAGFDMELLKPNAVVLGDSAGAYVLSTYFYQSPPGQLRGVDIDFIEGFNPEANLMVVAHKNNPDYCTPVLLKKVRLFTRELGLKLLILAENEQKMLKGGRFVEVDKSKLFGT